MLELQVMHDVDYEALEAGRHFNGVIIDENSQLSGVFDGDREMTNGEVKGMFGVLTGTVVVKELSVPKSYFSDGGSRGTLPVYGHLYGQLPHPPRNSHR